MEAVVSITADVCTILSFPLVLITIFQGFRTINKKTDVTINQIKGIQKQLSNASISNSGRIDNLIVSGKDINTKDIKLLKKAYGKFK